MQKKELMPCDLIMKGGTTSGTLYPSAVREIMKRYRLVNIGGTSAGAIAAAAAAAAEKGREFGSDQKLAEIADELKDRLLSFFQPRKEAKFLFDIGLAWLKFNEQNQERAKNDKLGKLVFVSRLTALWAKQYAKSFSIMVLLVFMSGLSVGWAFIEPQPRFFWMAIAVILGSVLYGVFWTLLSVLRTYQLANNQLSAKSGFGMCPGANQESSEAEAFADWFSGRLNDLAGISGRPLTFGDLGKDINLVVVSTSLADGAPVSLPFTKSVSDQYLFRAKDWKGKIPNDVLDWMVKRSAKVSFPGEDGVDIEFCQFPASDNLPVIVAVRMSLSFPLLFTTTKLYRKREGDVAPQEVVFTDGGVTSNFPIHFFDNVWPLRPTFGITLDRIELDDAEGIEPRFLIDLDKEQTPRKLESLMDFVAALLSAMTDWADNQQANLLTARQRIVQIPLGKLEGGLNLTMPKCRINSLVKRGAKAGKVFASFDFEQHRWTRYVSSVVSLAKSQATMKQVWENSTAGGEKHLEQLVSDYPKKVEVAEVVDWQEAALRFTKEMVTQTSDDLLQQAEGHQVRIKIVADEFES